MKATIVNYRMSRHSHSENQMVIKVEGVDTKEKAAKLIGKSVTWTTPSKKEIKGQITIAHGNKGAVRAQFETGMPGQAIGQDVKIL